MLKPHSDQYVNECSSQFSNVCIDKRFMQAN